MNAPTPEPRRIVPRAERLDRDRQAAPQVFERLRSMIISLDLPPGAPLSRASLAAQFGVSATPVRDALMRLDDEGLVEVFPQHATVVSRIDIFLARQAHFLRQALELELVRTLALDHSDELVRDLNRIIRLQQQFSAEGDFKAFMAEDNAFHQHLYAAADRQGLWELVRSRSGHIDRLRRLHLPSPGKAEAIMADHRAIVDAIAAGDPDAAQDRTRHHLAGTVANAVEISKLFPHYVNSD
jgi:DNA-binding GntR family transcriptional regulator